MRANELLEKELPVNATGDIRKLKTDIIGQVNNTDDEVLLDKIYTVLNKSGLADRISGILERDTDTSGFVTDITQLIIDMPGTYQEKHAFIQGFPTGYVDIKKMLSGERVMFTDLLTGGKFVQTVFNSLKRASFGTAKGPGEFALAVLSPYIRITGKGDLNIGKNIVEVKASAGANVSSGGGRLGTPGMLKSDDVASIIQTYTKINLAKAVPGGNIGFKVLIQLCAKLDANSRRELGKKLFGYIFGKGVNISGCVNALVADDEESLKKNYVMANYERYQIDSGFTGVMLINFTLGQLQYYKSPAAIVEHIYDPAVYLVSKDKAAQARQIISQVTLRPAPESKVLMPALQSGKSKLSPKDEDAIYNYANSLIDKAGIAGKPSDLLVDNIADIVRAGLLKGTAPESILRSIKVKFPELVKKKEVPTAPIQK
jgi:hypothetical protein